MANPGKLRVSLVDVRGRQIKEDVDVFLRHTRFAEIKKARIKPGPASSTIVDLHARPDGIYQVSVDPPSYQPFSQFVEVLSNPATRLDVVCAVDVDKVAGLALPAFADLRDDARRALDSSDTLMGGDGLTGAALLAKLDPIRQAGFLNIIGKTSETVFANGRSVASYLQKILELRGDRFFATVPQELREETKNSVHDGLFESVSGLLHHPPDGFTGAGSFKTRDRYGNLQLTFFARGNDWRADVDIDDAGGFEHVFQVLRNTLTGSPTHPYNIHQLLLQHQKLDPGYDLVL
jgi:hypothetical protein